MRAHRLADPDLILSCLRIVAASLIVVVVKVKCAGALYACLWMRGRV